MKNESPVGLATLLGVLPAVIAGVVFVILLVRNGGDVEAATAMTLLVVGALSTVATAALRQWRAVRAVQQTRRVVDMGGDRDT